MIQPTVGRVVLYHPAANSAAIYAAADGSPVPALIARVWNDRMINIGGFDANGNPFGATSVPLLQDDDAIPEGGNYACWMPYQKGQAAKTEALEKQITSADSAVSTDKAA